MGLGVVGSRRMGCSKKGLCQPWKSWGQQLSLQLDPVPPGGQSAFPIACLIFLFPEPAQIFFLRSLRYRSWLSGILAQNMPFYALPDLLVAARGEPRGFLLRLCFASKSQAFVPHGIVEP